MANKQALRDLQQRLAERMQAALEQAPGRSWLAIECGGHGFLLPLQQAGEIFSPATILPVPHANRWFLGVANLRGHLHGVVDLAGFLGVASMTNGRDEFRFVGFNVELDINCVLLVDRLAGLRRDTELTVEPHPDTSQRPAFVGRLLRDGGGRVWQELLLGELATDEAFLRIVG